ncbi:aminotransferase class IV [Hyphococcus lacteus]|uniref:Probable branched-chain-amino-acid aminotransferase n=1 Tax=Hyphococcus lacteus TaxID=3143536 RepID=A0ABV3Z2V5_9PROT
MAVYSKNGEYGEDPVSVDIADRGLLLGDGIFETILLRDGVPVFLGAHMARLTAGAVALGIDIKFDEIDITKRISELAVKNRIEKQTGSARVTLTRGAGRRGLSIEGANEPTLLITVNAYDRISHIEPANVLVSRACRAERSVSAKYKTLNYIDNVMAREEASAAKLEDAVMLNHAGRVACASAANVFIIRGDGEVVTPPVREGALPGVVRNIVLQSGNEAGLVIVEAEIERHELKKSAIILTNSLIGLRLATLKNGTISQSAYSIFEKLKSCYESEIEKDLKLRAGH